MSSHFSCSVVELTLWDEDYNDDDQIGVAVCLPLKNLQLDKPEHRTLKFGEVSKTTRRPSVEKVDNSSKIRLRKFKLRVMFLIYPRSIIVLLWSSAVNNQVLDLVV